MTLAQLPRFRRYARAVKAQQSGSAVTSPSMAWVAALCGLAFTCSGSLRASSAICRSAPSTWSISSMVSDSPGSSVKGCGTSMGTWLSM